MVFPNSAESYYCYTSREIDVADFAFPPDEKSGGSSQANSGEEPTRPFTPPKELYMRRMHF
jgi:hypothetical protein